VATILQTPIGNWQAIIRRKGTKTIKKTFTRKTDATNWAKVTEADIERGEYRPIKKGEKLTFTELAALFTDEPATEYNLNKRLGLCAMSPQQKRTVPGVLKFWQEQFGHLRLADIDRDIIQDATEVLSQRRKLSPIGRDLGPISSSTVRKYLSILGTVYKYAITKRLVDHSPLTNVDKPAANDERTRYLDKLEILGLLEAVGKSGTPELKPIVLLAIYTGLRKSELMGLTWERVNLSDTAKPYQRDGLPFILPPHSLLIEYSKNKDPRTLPIRGETLNALRAWQATARATHDAALLFPSRETPSKPLDFRTPWKTALRHAGITDLRWHDLRHTFASWATMTGANPIELAKLTGHRDLKSLNRYSHLSPEHAADIVERIAQRIEGGTD